MTTKYNFISEAPIQSSPKNVSMTLNIILYLRSFATKRIILSKLIYSYFVNVVMTQSFAFMDVVILVRLMFSF